MPVSSRLSIKEIAHLVDIFSTMGVEKVRLTGGEPLMRDGILDLVAELAANPRIKTLAMTTNGTRLRHVARDLRRSGLQALNISLDSLRSDRFERIAGRNKMRHVLAGIDEALAAGFPTLKLNVVVMRGVNDDELTDFVAFVRDKPIELRFIEFMPFSDNGWNERRLVPCQEMIDSLSEHYHLLPRLNADPSSTARLFSIEGWTGSIGFIPSMTLAFCGACNRLRLLADGSLKTCLFTPPSINLRDLLRLGASDQAIREQIHASVAGKPPEHPPLESLADFSSQEMTRIGG